MPKLAMPKFSLSHALENAFFKNRLTQNELKILKSHCESYQDLELPDWKPSILRAYSSYFGFITALKARSAIEQCFEAGYLKKQAYDIVDIGAGTLGASLGVIDFFNAKKLEVSSLLAVDKDQQAVEWASEEFKAFLPTNFGFRKRFPSANERRPQIIVYANVLTELGLKELGFEPHRSLKLKEFFLKPLKDLHEDSLVIIIEPSTRETNTNLLKLRDWIRSRFHILLPCTHESDCPALAQKEWCHEEWSYRAPARFWAIVKYLRFRKKLLSFGFLVLGKQNNRFEKAKARVVSREIPSKGRCEKWLCSAGYRWKESKLLRHRSTANQAYYEAARGAIIDCVSTDCHRPD